MRRRLGAVVLSFAAALAGSTWSPAVPAVAAQPTFVISVSPVNAAGDLRDGYTVTSHVTRGHCETGSIATGNAYRCLIGSKALDPCWVTSRKKVVDCLAKPWVTAVVQLKVTKGFANYGGVQKRADLPWGIQLADDTKCVRIQGRAAFIDGALQTYKCPHTNKVLVGNQIKRSAVWKIHEAKRTASHHYRMVGKVAIVDAWFGISSRKG